MSRFAILTHSGEEADDSKALAVCDGGIAIPLPEEQGVIGIQVHLSACKVHHIRVTINTNSALGQGQICTGFYQLYNHIVLIKGLSLMSICIYHSPI